MSSELEELKALYDQEKAFERNVISQKQQEYVQFLTEQTQQFVGDRQSIWEILTNLLEQPITNWTDLTQDQVRNLIKVRLPKNILITPQKLAKLYKSTDGQISKLNEKLKTNYQTFEQVSLYDYRRWYQDILDLSIRFKTKDIPLLNNFHWEYGYQLKDDHRFYYLRFYQLLMLDFDESDLTLEKLEKRLAYYSDCQFRIYQTYRGFHVFLMSCLMPYQDPQSWHLMRDLGCDDWYIFFVKTHGYKVRLNPKPGREDEQVVAKYLKTIGSGEVDPICQQLIEIHDQYLKKHQV